MTTWFVPRAFAAQRARERVATRLNATQEQILKVFAREHFPYEACGWIDKEGSIYPLPNVHDGDRSQNFAMDIPDFSAVAGIWHSHPRGKTTPSEDDEDFIRHLNNVGAHWDYYIVTQNEVYEYDISSFAA